MDVFPLVPNRFPGTIRPMAWKGSRVRFPVAPPGQTHFSVWLNSQCVIEVCTRNTGQQVLDSDT
jgi:hypothetical protein